jgi:hypothetical protein
MGSDLIENEEPFIVLDENREKTDEIEKYQVVLNHIKNIICHLVTRNIINNSVWCDLHISDYLFTGYAFTNIFAGKGIFPNNNLHLLSFYDTTGTTNTFIEHAVIKCILLRKQDISHVELDRYLSLFVTARGNRMYEQLLTPEIIHLHSFQQFDKKKLVYIMKELSIDPDTTYLT